MKEHEHNGMKGLSLIEKEIIDGVLGELKEAVEENSIHMKNKLDAMQRYIASI